MSIKIFRNSLLMIVLLGGASCNLPRAEKLNNLEFSTNGKYSFPLTKFSYNTNNILKDYFEYSLGVFRFIKKASDYNQNLGESETRKIILGDKYVEVFVKDNAQIDIDEVSILEGKMKMKMNYNTNVDVVVEYVIKELIDTNENPFRITINLPSNTEGIVEKEQNILGYKIKPSLKKNSETGETTRYFKARRKITAIISSLTKQINVNLVSTELSVSNPKIEYARGSFGNKRESLPDQVLSFVNVFSRSPKGTQFGNSGHRMFIDITNPFSIPVYVKFSEIKIFYSNGTSKNFNFRFSSSGDARNGNIVENTIRLDPATKELDGTLSFVRRTFKFDDINSNINQIFFGKLREFIYVSMKVVVEINPELKGTSKKLPGTISGKVDLSINLRGDLSVITKL